MHRTKFLARKDSRSCAKFPVVSVLETVPSFRLEFLGRVSPERNIDRVRILLDRKKTFDTVSTEYGGNLKANKTHGLLAYFLDPRGLLKESQSRVHRDCWASRRISHARKRYFRRRIVNRAKVFKVRDEKLESWKLARSLDTLLFDEDRNEVVSPRRVRNWNCVFTR